MLQKLDQEVEQCGCSGGAARGSVITRQRWPGRVTMEAGYRSGGWMTETSYDHEVFET